MLQLNSNLYGFAIPQTQSLSVCCITKSDMIELKMVTNSYISVAYDLRRLNEKYLGPEISKSYSIYNKFQKLNL